jgi:hypothetical protein
MVRVVCSVVLENIDDLFHEAWSQTADRHPDREVASTGLIQTWTPGDVVSLELSTQQDEKVVVHGALWSKRPNPCSKDILDGALCEVKVVARIELSLLVRLA